MAPTTAVVFGDVKFAVIEDLSKILSLLDEFFIPEHIAEKIETNEYNTNTKLDEARNKNSTESFDFMLGLFNQGEFFYRHVDFYVDITEKIDNDKLKTKYDVLKEKLYTYIII
uniref:Uncharacterized protein n=1 Tax=Romanomermis culicivorax TaxID=13658 RepID=A0A915KFU9_ROMCU